MKITILPFLKLVLSHAYKLFVLLGLLLVASSVLISCVSLKTHLNYVHRSDTRPPVDTFAFIMVQKVATPKQCMESPQIESCVALLQALPPIVQESSGSGMIVKTKKGAVVLTAAHVCHNPFPKMYDSDGIKFTVETDVIVKVRTSTGALLNASVVKIDEEPDLCALDVEKIYAPPVRIASKPPKVGDRVSAISAPMGVNAPTMSLVFGGFYSGYDEDFHFYTIPTRPGSSGSIVLDKRYRAVGMLNAAFVSMESIGLGAGHQDLVDFISDL